jgi:hypothetical protein
MPRAPAIFARPQELDEAECRLDIDALVRLGLEGATCIDYKFERGEVTARQGSPRRIGNRLAGKKAVVGQPAAHDAASN